MPEKKVVVDTSCLIALESIGIIKILCELYKEVVIPDSVLKEFGKLTLKCIKLKKVEEPLLNLLGHKLNLGRGEAEVTTFAFRNKEYLPVIDDMKARNIAKELGLKITGTVGLLARAERKGIISSAYKESLKLRKKGFYLPDKLLKQIKKSNTNKG
ncbi:DUF3368 domain-containing protein [candidate division WOR-3 bacterium]|nr:DUF3368 domain-containing protein [candidate division WOR-3 bacterium]